MIRGVDEIDDPASRPSSTSGTHTWRFTADSVRDFAWAAARHFVWDAARANGGKTLAMSFYPPSAQPIWKESTQYVRFAVDNYSSWYRYPYPVAINVNGIEGGMEYPMIVFCHNRTDAAALFSVTDHEIGHTWFPMVVGNNERRYAWMDEGFNTFMNRYNWDKKYPGQYNRRGNPGLYIPHALSGKEESMMTPADRIYGSLSVTAYTKPGLGLILLRDHIIGPARFDPAFKQYIARWAYKHPTPADFFRSMEDGVGEDLSWFWRSWFYTTETLDQAVDSVASDSGSIASRIYLRNAGAMPMPVELELVMDDGTVRSMSLPVEVWYGGQPLQPAGAGGEEGGQGDHRPEEAVSGCTAGEQRVGSGKGGNDGKDGRRGHRGVQSAIALRSFGRPGILRFPAALDDDGVPINSLRRQLP